MERQYCNFLLFMSEALDYRRKGIDQAVMLPGVMVTPSLPLQFGKWQLGKTQVMFCFSTSISEHVSVDEEAIDTKVRLWNIAMQSYNL